MKPTTASLCRLLPAALLFMTWPGIAQTPSGPKLEIYLDGQTTPDPPSKGEVIDWGSNVFGQTNVPAAAQSGVVAVAAGFSHTVALMHDGRVVAWGSNSSGQTNVPVAAMSGIVSVAAGSSHTVALKQDGSVIAWGQNSLGQTDVPAEGLSGAVAIAAGTRHTVALKQDGSVIAWGSDFFGQTTVPPSAESGVVAIAAGASHTVALKQDGSVIAWGSNFFGQTTVPPSAKSGVVAISTRNNHNVALKKDGSVIAWGDNQFGQSNVPLAAQSEVIAIAAGDSHTVALKQDGSVIAWGRNTSGEATVPASAQIDVTAIAAGGSHTVAIRAETLDFVFTGAGTFQNHTLNLKSSGSAPLSDLTATIIGVNADQFSLVGTALPSSLAAGTSAPLTVHFTPTQMGSKTAILRVSNNDSSLPVQMFWLRGKGMVASLKVTDGTGAEVSKETGSHVIAWGYNVFGQTSVPSAAQSGVTAISAGGYHTVALKQDGQVIAWGSNSSGQTNVPPAAQSDVIAMAAGGSHTIALRQDGSVVTWGSIATVPEAAQAGVVAISAGWTHSVALKQDGRVVTWGNSDWNKTPVPKMAQSSIIAIAAGGYHTVALKQDGQVIAWGDNKFAQTNVPRAAQSGVIAIAAGGYHTVALKQDGQVIAWGDNNIGQTSVPRTAQSSAIAIAAGGSHTVALKLDGQVIAWGRNDAGQTTVPSAAQSGVIAVAAGSNHTVALVESAGSFGTQQLGMARDHRLSLNSRGNIPLTSLRAIIEGPAADQFAITNSIAASLEPQESSPLTLRLEPTRFGPLLATLKIYSNDPASPFIMPLHGNGSLVATKTSVSGSKFTCSLLRPDPQTGLMLQTITFTNTTSIKLEGMKLMLSKVASGVQIYSSSLGAMPGTYEVIYSKAIAAGEKISFDLVYFDPLRRTADAISPVIKAEALLEPEPDSLPVAGTEVKLLSVRVTPQGPMLEWNSVPRATYVAEYSDDGGKTWFSAVHRLSTGGTRQFWIDRGQPETKTKPTGTPNKPGGRFYRMKKL